MKKQFKKFALVCSTAALLTAGTFSTAAAQEADFLVSNMFSTTTTGLTTTGIGGGIFLTVMLVSNSGSAQLETYMEQNAVAMQHDLYLGGGDTARDLAGLFNVSAENLDAFASLLYEQRHQLAPLAEPGQIDAVSAHKFKEHVVAHMLRDVRLAGNARALLG